MVSGISGLPVSDFSGTVGICHPDGYHYRRPCQRSCALDDLYGITVPTVGVGKMAVIIAVSFILSKKQDEYGANPKAFKYIMILTGLVFLLIAPENLSTAMLLFGVVCMMMFIGRVSSKKLFGMLGLMALVGIVAVGNTNLPFPERHCTIHRDFTVSRPGRTVFPASSKMKRYLPPSSILIKTHR